MPYRALPLPFIQHVCLAFLHRTYVDIAFLSLEHDAVDLVLGEEVG